MSLWRFWALLDNLGCLDDVVSIGSWVELSGAAAIDIYGLDNVWHNTNGDIG